MAAKYGVGEARNGPCCSHPMGPLMPSPSLTHPTSSSSPATGTRPWPAGLGLCPRRRAGVGADDEWHARFLVSGGGLLDSDFRAIAGCSQDPDEDIGRDAVGIPVRNRSHACS